MSYYSIDLVSSFPSGAAGGGAAVEAPPVKTAVPAPAPAPVETPKVSPKEFIRLPGKINKPPTPTVRQPPKSVVKHPLNMSAALGTGTAEGPGSGAGGANGSGVMAEGGASFPFPWYLKQVSDRLDQQWKPPQEFQPGTLCQVGFVIARSGQVSDISIEKASGDNFFDQLGLRAVQYSNPLPPLPGGYPEDTLRVHMKFVGKGQ